MTQSGTGNKGTSVKQGKTRMGYKDICERQEDHGDMGTDINETWNAGMKEEMRGTGMNGGVSEM